MEAVSNCARKLQQFPVRGFVDLKQVMEKASNFSVLQFTLKNEILVLAQKLFFPTCLNLFRFS
jgi:hypothetical protein